MKKYFARYLPVDGEIEEGDLICWWIDNAHGDIVVAKENGGCPIKYKKAKLFLCSRDIQAEDNFWGRTEQICTKIEMGSGENYYPKEMLVWFHDNGINYWQPLEECFKVMGEISPDALGYVKEGQEFEEDDWRLRMKTINKKIGSIEVEKKHLNRFKATGMISYCSIKGPCGHFH